VPGILGMVFLIAGVAVFATGRRADEPETRRQLKGQYPPLFLTSILLDDAPSRAHKVQKLRHDMTLARMREFVEVRSKFE
jgi:hypothetical protein